MRWKRWVCWVLLGLGTLGLFGQPLIPEIEAPPRIEQFLNMAPPPGHADRFLKVSGFIQREPRDGQPASEKTEVYLCHDQQALYAVFVAFTADPGKIRARLAPREQVFDDDSVNIMIDTFNDQRRGYTFLATPKGVQWDGVFIEGSGFDASFNAVWASEGKVTSQGFVVWMAIPFKSLRFPDNGDKIWRIILNRTIQDTDEDAFWPRYTNRIQGRLNQAVEVKLEGNIKAGKNFQIVPYGAFRSFRLLDPDHPEGPRYIDEDADTDVGVDAKFVFKDSLVLDLAVNPDFSQVESDEPQITVNERFEVFFPERRPFFLENADLFSTPFNLVFTRRISDPRVGARFTGKLGRWSFGTLAMDDEAPGKRVPENDPVAGKRANFGIIRLTRDIFQQSTIGMLVTDREFDGRRNRVVALDGRMLWNENWNSVWQVAHSKTDVAQGNIEDQAINASLNRSGRKLNYHFHYVEVGPEFRTRTGFLGSSRPDTRNFHARPSYRFRPEGETLLAWGPQLLVQRTWDFDDVRLDDEILLEMEWELAGQTEIFAGRRWYRELLRPEDFPNLNQNLDFTGHSWQLNVETAWLAKWSFSTNMVVGTRPNFEPAKGQFPELADGTDLSLNTTWRPISRLRLDGDFLFSELEQRGTGAKIFRNRIYRARMNWQFNRALSLRSILQFDSIEGDSALTSLEDDRNLNGDLLLTYLINPWTAVYAGYNSNFSNFEWVETENGRRVVPTRRRLNEDAHQVFVKFSYLWR